MISVGEELAGRRCAQALRIVILGSRHKAGNDDLI
jgi:hypothetical protein